MSDQDCAAVSDTVRADVGRFSRFILLPWANAHPGAHWAESYCCDECDEKDYAHTYEGGDITPFYRDAETDETICETCKAKREANIASHAFL